MSKTTTEQVLTSDKRKKQRLVNALGGKCCICGYDKCLSALEFHHTDPNEKDFTIGNNTQIAFEKALKEAKKCILVCANCHREIHAGLITNIPLTSYNEELANIELNKFKEIKAKKIFYCRDCGKEISYGAIRCFECSKEHRKKIKRPERQELKDLIRVLPFTQIGEKYGITDNAVRKWCDALNLPRTKKEINQYSNEDWEKI